MIEKMREIRNILMFCCRVQGTQLQSTSLKNVLQCLKDGSLHTHFRYRISLLSSQGLINWLSQYLLFVPNSHFLLAQSTLLYVPLSAPFLFFPYNSHQVHKHENEQESLMSIKSTEVHQLTQSCMLVDTKKKEWEITWMELFIFILIESYYNFTIKIILFNWIGNV